MSIKTESHEFITLELLSALFNIDLDTGTIVRKITTGSKAKAGTTVGYINDSGYLEFMLFGNKYLVHRILWFVSTGEFPTEFIDHKDLNKTNNSIDNLRLCTNKENSHNTLTRKDNTTGYKGVSLDKRCGKYRAYININGKQKSLGYYTTALEASIVREAAAKALHGEFYNNG
jgi:hypothetical protein